MAFWSVMQELSMARCPLYPLGLELNCRGKPETDGSSCVQISELLAWFRWYFKCTFSKQLANYLEHNILSAFQGTSAAAVFCLISHSSMTAEVSIHDVFSLPGALCPRGWDGGTDRVQRWAGPALAAGGLHGRRHLLHLRGHLGAHSRLHPSRGSYAGTCGSEPTLFWHLENEVI